ncbi:hypothetical protein [Flavobacterium sp. UBA4854]|uniref:hypothetical protein n=1 Tax=Flavobacterium sp. UBA4854 TaxID=1946548 RepID=UPI00257977F3|nr:hypothetical protein [Flavobacterium sp. UBA4854]
MKLEQWVLFIDMLGYRDINGGIKNRQDAEDFIAFMKSNVEIFKMQDRPEVVEGYKKGIYDLYAFYEIQVVFISDSLIINYLPREIEEIPEHNRLTHSANTLFIIIKRLQTFLFNCMKEKGIIVRGGISSKFCLVDGNFAVGEGLIEAYIVESTVANYPRICLSKEIAANKELLERFDKICSLIYKEDTFLGNDNGVLYLDYLKHNLKEPDETELQRRVKDSFFKLHRETIKAKLSDIDARINVADDSDAPALKKVKEKIMWLKNYHNSALAQFHEYVI